MNFDFIKLIGDKYVYDLSYSRTPPTIHSVLPSYNYYLYAALINFVKLNIPFLEKVQKSILHVLIQKWILHSTKINFSNKILPFHGK